MAGHEVLTATDGAEAVAAAVEAQPDIVILDIMMPRMDGLTALGQLRQGPLTQNIPILLLSAKKSALDIEVGMKVQRIDEHGADACGARPVDVEFGNVAQHHRLRGRRPQTFQRQVEDPRIGFGDADLARDHDYVEPALEWTLRTNSSHRLRHAI